MEPTISISGHLVRLISLLPVTSQRFLESLTTNNSFPVNASGSLTNSAWNTAFLKSTSLVSQMTLSEKANLTSGILARCAGTLGSVPRLGIPETCLQDGPAGVRGPNGISQFPAGLTVAATWDRELIYERARAMGQEFRDQGELRARAWWCGLWT